MYKHPNHLLCGFLLGYELMKFPDPKCHTTGRIQNPTWVLDAKWKVQITYATSINHSTVYSVHSYKSLHKSKSLKEPKPLEKDFKTQILVSIPKIMYPIKYTPAYIKMKSTYMKAMWLKGYWLNTSDEQTIGKLVPHKYFRSRQTNSVANSGLC